MTSSRIFWIICFQAFLFTGNVSAQNVDVPSVPDTNRIYRSLSDALLNPDLVHKLDLSRKKLDTLPEDIFLFKNLKVLDLSRNRLTFIQAEISGLKNLVSFDLSNNDLSGLPDEIGALTKLTYLGLNRNVIDSLPPSIGLLVNLEVLELWDNELNDVPDEFSELKNLKVLELRGILFSDEQQTRIDELVVPGAKIHMSPSCNCKY